MTLATLLSVPLIGNVGWTEMVLILLAILLLFGGSKLPQLGKGLGEGIRNFKKGIKGDDPEGDKPASDSKEISKDK